MQFIKDLVKPVDPSYVKWIKGSDDVISNFSGKNATFDGGGSLAGSIVSNSTTPLKDVRDYKYTSALTSNGDYWGYTFDVPMSLRGNTAVFEYLFKANDNTKFNIVAKDVTNNSIIQSSTIPANNSSSPQHQFIFTIPATCVQVKIGWQYNGSVASDTFEYDNLVFKLWTPTTANLVTQEAIAFIGYTSGTTGGVKFKTLDTARLKYGDLVTYDNSGAYTKFIVLKKCLVNVATSNSGSNASYFSLVHYGVTESNSSNANSYANTGKPVMALPGDFFYAYTNSTPNDSTGVNFSITASAVAENITQSWQDGTEWTKYTPSVQGFTSITSDDVRYKRVGSDLFIQGFFSNTSSGATEARVYLPSGLVINTGTSSNKIVGQSARETASANGAMNVLAKNGATYLTFGIQSASYAGLTNRLASELLGAESFSFWAKIPIQGWSSTPTLVALPTSKDNNKIYDKTLVAVTSDVAGWVNDFVEIYPYRTISKVTGLPIWRMTFNIRGTVTAGTRLFTNLTIPGVSIKTNQSFSGITSIISPMYNSTTSTGLYMEHNSGSTIWYTASGDIELNSKPTWADEWIEPGVFVGNVQPDYQYNLTLSGGSYTSTIRAVGVVYKMGSGEYRLKFNAAYSVSSGARTSHTITISGVTFKNVANFSQMVSGGNDALTVPDWAIALPNTSTIGSYHTSATTTKYYISGDVELESKPAFAVNTP